MNRLLLAALGCALLFGPALGEPTVEATLEPLDLEVGGRAVLTIIVEGGGSIDDDLRWPLPEGLSVRSAGESRNFSMVNGKFSQSTQRRYLVTPLREGRYELPVLEIHVGGRAYRFGPWALTARAVASQPSPEAPGAGPSRSGSGAIPAVLVEMTVEPSQLFVGQQAILSVRFLQRADIAVYDARFVPPETEGFWKEDLPQIPHGVERRPGATYEVTEIRLALFPTRPGRLEISPARVRVQYRTARRDPFSFFGLSGPDREEEPASAPCIVTVKPLPQPAPPGFTGAVGDYSIRSSFDREAARQGEPINWTVEIRGAGNVTALEGPQFPEIPGCRGLDGGESLDRERDTRIVGGTKRFTRILIPDRAGTIRIPSIAWAHYDPAEGRYVASELAGRDLVVEPALGYADADAKPAERLGEGLRPIFSRTRLHSASAERPWSHPLYAAGVAAPLLALAAIFALRRRREMDRLDPVGARMRAAPRNLRRSLERVGVEREDPWGGLVRGVEDYLCAQYGPEVRGLTRSGLRAHLTEQGCEREATERIVEILEQADARRYLPASAASEDDLREAIRASAESATRLKGGRRG